MYCNNGVANIDNSYICGEQTIMYKFVTSLTCKSETNVSWCVNYTQIKIRKRKSYYIEKGRKERNNNLLTKL